MTVSRHKNIAEATWEKAVNRVRDINDESRLLLRVQNAVWPPTSVGSVGRRSQIENNINDILKQRDPND